MQGVREGADARAARAARFAAEAARPPPPLPTNRLVAHTWGGKVTKSDTKDSLKRFLARKAGSGAALTPAQARAAATVSPVVAPIIARPPPAYSETADDLAAAAADDVLLPPPAAPPQPLRGLVFGLSAGGGEVSQRELAALIAKHGGAVSNTIHKRVDFVVASERAVRRNTQAVRKARDKFGIPLVTPQFVVDSARAKRLCDHAEYAPAARAPRAAAAPAPAPVAAAPTSHFLYYWDDRDGDDWAGWWLTPHAIGDDRYVLHNAERTLLPHREGWRANAKIVDAHGGAQPDVAVRCIFRLPSSSWLAEPIIMVTGAAATALDGVDFSQRVFVRHGNNHGRPAYRAVPLAEAAAHIRVDDERTAHAARLERRRRRRPRDWLEIRPWPRFSAARWALRRRRRREFFRRHLYAAA